MPSKEELARRFSGEGISMQDRRALARLHESLHDPDAQPPAYGPSEAVAVEIERQLMLTHRPKPDHPFQKPDSYEPMTTSGPRAPRGRNSRRG